MNSSDVVQIIFGIMFVTFLAFIAYIIYNKELLYNLSTSGNNKKDIVVFDGIMDFSTSSYNINTYNKSASSFKDLTPSINQNGGAEYSYNFWIYMDRGKITSSNDIILLLRGDKLKVPYLNKTNCQLQKSNNGYYMIKNPLIRMKSDGSALIVEYNTLTNPDSYREYGKNATDCSVNSWYEKNKGLLGIYDLNNYVYDKKWFMITIVLQETIPENDILNKNKTVCRMYINGINVLDRIVESPYNNSYGSSAMKHNRGKLYINPDKESITNPQDDALKLANMSYHNYSLEPLEIVNLFNKGFTKSQAVIATDNEDDLRSKYQIANINDDNLPMPF